jgi:hypothetical protein
VIFLNFALPTISIIGAQPFKRSFLFLCGEFCGDKDDGSSDGTFDGPIPIRNLAFSIAAFHITPIALFSLLLFQGNQFKTLFFKILI